MWARICSRSRFGWISAMWLSVECRDGCEKLNKLHNPSNIVNKSCTSTICQRPPLGGLSDSGMSDPRQLRCHRMATPALPRCNGRASAWLARCHKKHVNRKCSFIECFNERHKEPHLRHSGGYCIG